MANSLGALLSISFIFVLFPTILTTNNQVAKDSEDD